MTTDQRLGRYELVRVLGTGGMGEVWEAVLHGPAGFRKAVAVKRLRSGMVGADVRDALVEEARLGALLQHPNIVSIIELGEAAGSWFVAMELVRGVPPLELAPGPLPPAAVVEIGIQCCAGLAHIHALEVDGRRVGLVHRDVKPGNLLVDRHGLVRITDLGLAAVAGRATDGSGTPGYVPPEQQRGWPDPRSDLFALGATLYVLSTRRRPFGGGAAAVAAVFRVEQLLADAAFLAPVEAAVPGLGAIVRRCLRLDPADRWADAVELQGALRAVAAGLPGPSLAELVESRFPSGTVGVSNRTPSKGPDPATLLRTRGNVGTAVDGCFGRDEERDRIASLVRDGARLVTLLGPGGMGKTRLSLEVARGLAGELSGGVWFCDLSEATTADGICASVARALGVTLDAGPPVERVTDVLRGLGRALVVLDNFEQVAALGASTAVRWREGAPEAHFLVTSRVALRLRGEEVVALGPLDTDAATALFRARAGPIPDDAPVAALVGRLDGHPLAIELAAARARTIPVASILARLDDRFRLLAGGGADLPERHRSLRASLDGSYELLPDAARAAFAQLSVFADGFTAEAAEAVVDVADGPWTLDVLTLLADHALLRLDAARGRFRMLGMIQEYAATRLDARERRSAEARHGGFYAQLGTDAALSAAARSVELEDQVEHELENLVVAARRALARSDVERAAELATAACTVLLRVGPYGVAVELAETAAATCGGWSGRPRLARTLADAYLVVGRLDDARTVLEGALADGTASEDPASFLGGLGSVAEMQGRTEEAVARFRAALGCATDPWRITDVESKLGIVLRVLGRSQEARAMQEQALARARAVGDRRTTSTVLGSLGYLHVVQGRRDDGIACLTEAALQARANRDPRMLAIHLGNLGQARLGWGELADATADMEEAIRLLRRLGERRWEAIHTRNLGMALFQGCRYRDAGDTFHGPLEVFRGAGDYRNIGITAGLAAWVGCLTGGVPDPEPDWAEALDWLTQVGDRREIGLVQSRRAVFRHLSGRPGPALEDADAAAAFAREVSDHTTLAGATSARLEALLGLGRPAEVEAGVAALELLEPPPAPRTRIVRARLALLRGDPAAARSEVASAGRPVDLFLRVRSHARRAGRGGGEATHDAAPLHCLVRDLPPHALLARIAGGAGSAP